MSKSFEYAKEITVAALGFTGGNGVYPHESTGENVAGFFEAVYNKLSEIEKLDNEFDSAATKKKLGL